MFVFGRVGMYCEPEVKPELRLPTTGANAVAAQSITQLIELQQNVRPFSSMGDIPTIPAYCNIAGLPRNANKVCVLVGIDPAITALWNLAPAAAAAQGGGGAAAGPAERTLEMRDGTGAFTNAALAALQRVLGGSIILSAAMRKEMTDIIRARSDLSESQKYEAAAHVGRFVDLATGACV